MFCYKMFDFYIKLIYLYGVVIEDRFGGKVMNYILMSHGGLAKGALSSVEMIMGKPENVNIISIDEDSSLQGTVEKITEKYEENGQEDTFIICDVLGGTPSNAGMNFVATHPNSQMVTGMNLPMLLEIFMNDSNSLEKLKAVSKKAYKKGFSTFDYETMNAEFIQDEGGL